jgi:2-hydroxy-3-oxopropionate reductase
MKIGFIGSGIMGRPMAETCCAPDISCSSTGAASTASNPCWSPALSARARRRSRRRSRHQLHRRLRHHDVEQIILGDRGLVHGARPGHTIVDMSTVAPAATRRIAAALAERGVHMLDAPVSGGEVAAREGKLSIMVGGEAPIFEKIRPLFEVLGKNIVHVGGHGAGQVVKCCNQIVVGLTFEGVAEAILLARRNGVDPVKMRERCWAALPAAASSKSTASACSTPTTRPASR